MSDDLTRRDVVKIAGAAGIATAVGGPLIRTAKAATNAVQFGMIGVRETFLITEIGRKFEQR